jgi:hypothetical protein
MSEHLKASDIFRRKHGFARPREDYPQNAWWTATGMNPATAEGWAYLEIVEIVSTATLGRMVIYREWWIDPDGNEVEPTQDWIPDKGAAAVRAERNLLRSIASKKMEPVSRSVAASAQPGPVAPARAVAAVEPKDEHRLDLGSMRVAGTA